LPNPIEFTIPGVPVPKGRPRGRMIGKGPMARVQIYTPPETQAAESNFLMRAKKHRPPHMLDGPLRVDILFVVPAPASLHGDRSRKWPEVRPDIDNYSKLVLDALNGIFWHDDGQVCASSVVKVYGHPPRTEVRITKLSDVDEAQHALWEGR